MSKTRKEQTAELQQDWATNPRWANVKRGYTAEDVAIISPPSIEQVRMTFAV